MAETTIKYKTEVEMCRDVTKLISAILHPTKHKHIPEVPRSSGNNHSDMLFIYESGKMFIVEYKLRDVNSLAAQVHLNHYTIGIINQETKTSPEYGGHRIFQYTGRDREIEKISFFIQKGYYIGPGPFGGHYKKPTGNEPIYYWGYLEAESSLEGGVRSGERKSMYQLYMDAVINLQKQYKWKLDFYLVHSVLGYYSPATALKHYKNAMARRTQ